MVKRTLRYLAELDAVQRGRVKVPEGPTMPVHFAFALWALGAKIALVLLVCAVVAFTVL